MTTGLCLWDHVLPRAAPTVSTGRSRPCRSGLSPYSASTSTTRRWGPGRGIGTGGRPSPGVAPLQGDILVKFQRPLSEQGGFFAGLEFPGPGGAGGSPDGGGGSGGAAAV